MIFIVEWARTADGGRVRVGVGRVRFQWGRVRVDKGARTLSGGARRRRLGKFGLWTCDRRK
jgi:hypothetical protein